MPDLQAIFDVLFAEVYSICRPPAILAVNACVNSEDNLKIWMDRRNQTFLQPRVELQGQVEGVDDPEKIVYELRVRLVY